MIVVRLRPTKLIVLDDRPGTDVGGTAGKILQKAASPIVAHQNIQLAIGPESQHTAVMIATQLLISVGLIGAQFDEVAIECERCAVPDIAIHTIAKR